MNRFNYPVQYRNEGQDSRFLPFLAGIAITAPFWAGAGRFGGGCPNCIVPVPVYPPQPFPTPYPTPAPFPAPYPNPTPYPYPYPLPTPTTTGTPNIDYNTTIYVPGYPGTAGVPFGAPGATGVPFGTPGVTTTITPGVRSDFGF